MTTAAANGIELCYETFGRPADPPVILIMGLGTQMIAWPDELCAGLASDGFYVVRFDNRDVGLSTHLSALPAPSPLAAGLRRGRPPYRVEDMADDTAGLLDALGLGSAHVVGASLGGFIAQSLAIRHPTAVRSLTLVMTSTGSRRVGRPKAKLIGALLTRRQRVGRDAAVQAAVGTFRKIGSVGFPFDADYLADLAGRSWDRSHDADGYLRQLAAVMAQSDRTSALRNVPVPTVVVHGLADPLVGVSGGRAVAGAIPGARFVGIPGMGHDLPRGVWETLRSEIASVAAAGEERLGATR